MLLLEKLVNVLPNVVIAPITLLIFMAMCQNDSPETSHIQNEANEATVGNCIVFMKMT